MFHSHFIFACLIYSFISWALSSVDESFSEGKGRTDSNSETIKYEHRLFTRLCPLLVIRLLPLRVFDDLNSPLVYGEIPHNSAVHGMFLTIDLIKDFLNLDFIAKCASFSFHY